MHSRTGILICSTLVAFGIFHDGKPTGAEDKAKPEYAGIYAGIDVQLKFVTGSELISLFGASSRGGDERSHFYILGSATYAGPKAAWITLEVRSPNNSTILAKDVMVGWLGRTRVYFLSYLGQPLLRTKLSEVQLEYRIMRVTLK